MSGERLRHLGAWAGLLVVLGGAFGRAVCRADPFPWWEADAFAFAPPLVGLTPTWALLLNAVILAGAGVVVGCVRGLGWWVVAMATAGMASVCWHAVVDLERATHGADLAAGMGALLAAWAGSSLPGARRVMVGLALGFGVWLGVNGLQEVYIEHPRTLATFEQTRDSFYAARGWEPDGPEAAMYEERLSHAEPTGAFGLTNVLATFAGAGAVGLLGLALSAGRWTRAARLALVAGAVLSAWALMATVSKGAIGATALGALVAGVGWTRWRAWAGRAVLGAALLVIAAVLARGAVGERIGERSLLFRAQYMQGTVAVLGEHPVAGVGPGRFQDAYTRLKPARAPEEVTSPHSLAFDWAGVLGLGGLAWLGVVAAGFGRRAEAAGPEPEGGVDGPPVRVLVRAACGVVALAVLLAAYTGRSAMVPENAAAILLGGVGWAVIGGLVCAMGGWAGVRAAALGVGAVALVHGQLDVTPVWAVSAPLWGLLVGLGIGAVRAGPSGERAWAGRAGAGVLVVTAAVLGVRAPAVAAWEDALGRAAEWPQDISMARLDLSAAVSRGDAAGVGEVADRVSGWLGQRVPAEEGAVSSALDSAVVRSQEAAADGLRSAVEARPGHIGTRGALCRVLVTIAMRDEDRAPARARAAWEEAVTVASEGVVRRPMEPTAWTMLGGVAERGTVFDPERADRWLARAVDAWIGGDRLTPHSPVSAARVAEGLARVGDAEAAAGWAVRALGRDDALDLDPRRRLSASRRAAMERIARSGAPAGGSP